MVGVRVGECMLGDGLAAQLAQDTSLALPRGRFEQDAVRQVDVDRVLREPLELEDPIGHLTHRTLPPCRHRAALGHLFRPFVRGHAYVVHPPSAPSACSLRDT
jgi:hypothetical protein